MDSVRAKHMAAELAGIEINGWTIGKPIDNGKSALVLHAIKDGKKAAIKVFDRELVETCGKSIQLERIKREKLLIGKHHENLIKVLDGGYCDNVDYCYVVMEYLPGDTLSKVIDKIPAENIAGIISQLASAAQFLDDLGLAHRDIKPENIRIISNKGVYKAVLLDLGVIRPTSISKITDGDGYKSFVGTLQYSSPEFLLREEEDTPEGWRAVTFYQLGAVLHDLIMQRQIFHDHLTPFAKLVNAVQHHIPTIYNPKVNPKLVVLAKNCLIKDPVFRLQSVSYDDFKIDCTAKLDIDSLKLSIQKNISATKEVINKTDIKRDEMVKHIQFDLQKKSDSVLKVLKSLCTNNKQIFPPIENKIDFLTDKSIRIILLFSPSVTHCMYAYLYVVIDIILFDHSDSIYNIKLSGITSSGPITDSDINNATQVNIYTGKFDSKQIEILITPVFYKIYAHSQELSISNNKSAEIILPINEYCNTDLVLHI